MRFSALLLPLAALAMTATPAQAQLPKAALATPAEVAADPANTWILNLSSGDEVTVQLRPDFAPLSVARIQLLTRQGFYDNLPFHRVIDGFMAQAGNPETMGRQWPDLPSLPPEFTDYPHMRGVVSMARADALDSATGEFFITFAPNLYLDGNYSPVGRVVKGMAGVDKIVRGEPPRAPTFITRARLGDMPLVAPAAATVDTNLDTPAQ